MPKDLIVLIDALTAGFNNAIPNLQTKERGEWQPVLDDQGHATETFCNFFTQSVAAAFGYANLSHLNANAIFDFVSTPANGWVKIDGAVAQSHANAGGCVIAAQKNPDGHGHVCVVCPGKMEFSGSYQKNVPKCVNVGKDVFFGKKMSFAFRTEPDYFVLGETV